MHLIFDVAEYQNIWQTEYVFKKWYFCYVLSVPGQIYCIPKNSNSAHNVSGLLLFAMKAF